MSQRWDTLQLKLNYEDLSRHQSHLGEELNSFKGRPKRCLTCQLETTNIHLQPDRSQLNQTSLSLAGFSDHIHTYMMKMLATHHKQKLPGPLHMLQELVAHAFVHVSSLDQAWEISNRNLPEITRTPLNEGKQIKRKPVQQTVKGHYTNMHSHTCL